jgi:hypothetical protein
MDHLRNTYELVVQLFVHYELLLGNRSNCAATDNDYWSHQRGWWTPTVSQHNPML